jgi:hypothetical protein
VTSARRAGWDEIDDAAHVLQDTHGDRVARTVLARIEA